MKNILFLFLCSYLIISCNSSKSNKITSSNYYKVSSIDTSTFIEYNFIILENATNIFSLLTKKEKVSDIERSYIILDTLKKNRYYKLSIEINDTLTHLSLKNKSYPIQGYIYNKEVLWKNDTLLVPTFTSMEVKGIFLFKRN